MKSFKEYLAESKKVYHFKVKVAGELPEGFQDGLKNRLDRYDVVNLEEIAKTPIQKLPLDFPEMENSEVTVYEVITEYPLTPPEVEKYVTELGLSANRVRVRGSAEPSELRQIEMQAEEEDEKEKDALLKDSEYSESSEIDHKDYFGEDHKESFLQDLMKAQQERIKELEHDKLDSNVYQESAPEQDNKPSAMGSK